MNPIGHLLDSMPGPMMVVQPGARIAHGQSYTTSQDYVKTYDGGKVRYSGVLYDGGKVRYLCHCHQGHP